MNKRGFLGIGVLIVLAIFVILMVGGLIAFISFNKFIIIGAGLIALTLIFGFKGEFTKQKGVFMSIFIIIGLVLILSSGVLQSTNPSHVFIDKDLGMITTEKQGGITQAFFKNTAGSGITVANLGDSVKVCDVLWSRTSEKYTKFDRITKLNGNQIIKLDLLSYVKTGGGTYCQTFTPSKAGNYEVVTQYTVCPDIIGAVRPEDCLSRSSDSTKQYFLEVKPKDQVCNKNPYTGNWYVSSNIDNGKVMKQDVFKVTNDCAFQVNYRNVMTICDGGFLIEGTNLRQTSNDGWKCVAYVPPEPDEPEPEIDAECNLDLFTECGDGTIILAKICTDGVYSDNLECSTIGNDGNEDDNRDDDGDGIPNDVDDDDDNDGILDVDDDDKDGNGILDKDEDESKKNFMQQYGYWIVGGFLALVVLILIIWVVKKK